MKSALSAALFAAAAMQGHPSRPPQPVPGPCLVVPLNQLPMFPHDPLRRQFPHLDNDRVKMRTSV